MKTIQELVSLKGKTALVTGAANGIGAAISHRFAESGASLILVDIDEDGLKKAKVEIEESYSVQVKIYSCNLSKIEQIEQLWDYCVDYDVNILVNNAGIYPFKKFLDLDADYYQKVMDLNLNSVLWMCQAFIKKNIKQGGAIVNMGSIEAILPFKKDLSQYSMSKVGVITLTRDLAREFASKNFRINCILPGGILTKGTKSAAISALKRMDLGLIKDGYNFKQRIPIGRLGNPDEIATMTLTLCSDLATYVHGALIPVDGGFLSN